MRINIIIICIQNVYIILFIVEKHWFFFLEYHKIKEFLREIMPHFLFTMNLNYLDSHTHTLFYAGIFNVKQSMASFFLEVKLFHCKLV